MSELATTTQLEDISRSGSQILVANASRAEQAVAVGRKIIDIVKESGMSPELDERCNKYLVNCRTAKGDMEVQRKPITTFFDTIRKQFTEAEAKVDAAKADSIPAQIQAYRNDYVKKLRVEEEQRKAAAQKKVDHDNEVIEIRANVEKQLSEYLQAHTLGRKQSLQTSFNGITLENYTEKANGLKALVPSYKADHFHTFVPSIVAKHCTADEVQQIKIEFMQTQDITLLAAVIESDLIKFKNDLVEKLPSLKSSLEEMAKAGEEQKKKLEQEKAEREKKQQAELQAQADAEARKKQEEIDLKKTSDQTEALMDNLSVSQEGNTPENRSGFNIVITHPAGILEIINFWFQKEGVNLSIAELEKKTIAQIKTYCQNFAHKNEEKITSKYLTYEPVYKAVNRK